MAQNKGNYVFSHVMQQEFS